MEFDITVNISFTVYDGTFCTPIPVISCKWALQGRKSIVNLSLHVEGTVSYRERISKLTLSLAGALAMAYYPDRDYEASRSSCPVVGQGGCMV